MRAFARVSTGSHFLGLEHHLREAYSTTAWALDSLERFLIRHGYHGVLQEREKSDEFGGASQHFKSQIPCLLLVQLASVLGLARQEKSLLRI